MAIRTKGTKMSTLKKRYLSSATIAFSATALVMLTAPGANALEAPQAAPPVIQVCVKRNGKIVGVDVPCKFNQVSITWNIPGPQGAAGAVGQQGAQGPTGSQGAVGPAGAIGAAGAAGPTGPTGPAGPTGTQGVTGAQGPQGLTGPQGPAGAMGPQGVAGTNGLDGTPGDNLATLAGGTMSVTIYPTSTSSDYYFGAGNGYSQTSNDSLVSESTPLPAGTLENLTVTVLTNDSVTPGETVTYAFSVCVNSVCSASPLTCSISPSTSATTGGWYTCSSPAASTEAINNGDRFSIQMATTGAGITDGDEVNWTMNEALPSP